MASKLDPVGIWRETEKVGRRQVPLNPSGTPPDGRVFETVRNSRSCFVAHEADLTLCSLDANEETALSQKLPRIPDALLRTFDAVVACDDEPGSLIAAKPGDTGVMDALIPQDTFDFFEKRMPELAAPAHLLLRHAELKDGVGPTKDLSKDDHDNRDDSKK